MNELDLLKAQVAELMEWKRQRTTQQLTYPLDQASKNIVAAPRDEGRGATALTQSYNVSGGMGGSVTAPKAYADSQILLLPDTGVRIEVPVLSYP